MRHRKSGRKFGVSSSHRKAMLRNMADSLIQFGRIETTVERAKELRKLAERLITLAKTGTLASKRRALKYLRTKGAFVKLFGDYADRFKDRNGGYTRIVRTKLRTGDNAQLAIIEYLAADESASKGDKKKRRRRSSKRSDEAETVKEKPVGEDA